MPTTPYMKLYIGDYLGDTSHLTTLQHGAYLLLIMAYWQRGGPLRNTDVLLSNIARTTSEEWALCRETVLEFFEERDGYLFHKRIDIELHKRAEISTKCKIAIDKRWHGSDTDVLRTNYGRNTTPIVHIPDNINNKNSDKIATPKHEYGSEKNVLLTDAQYSKLVSDLGESMALACIEELSSAKAMKGYKYKRDDLAIRKWVVDAVRKRGDIKPSAPSPAYSGPIPEMAELTRRHREELEARDAGL